MGLGAVSAVSLFLYPDLDVGAHLWGMLAASVPMCGICFVAPGAFGGGDIKLMAAAGLGLGWKGSLLAASVGILASGAYCLIRMCRYLAGKEQERVRSVPLGPFLAVGIAVAAVAGEYIWNSL